MVQDVVELIKGGADVNQTGFHQRAPLHVAAIYGHGSVVGQLLQARADVNVKDKDGKTPLDLAYARVEVKTVLRKHGGKHSLLYAASKGMVQDVAELIKGGADVNQTGSDQRAPLHVAAVNGHGSVVDQLLQARADVNVKDEDGKTPLDYWNLQRQGLRALGASAP